MRYKTVSFCARIVLGLSVVAGLPGCGGRGTDRGKDERKSDGAQRGKWSPTTRNGQQSRDDVAQTPTYLKTAPAADGGLHAPAPNDRSFNTEAYDRIYDNPFMSAADNPLSTFSIDVDTASYANVRRYFNAGQWPPKDAVRIEELVNYFTYDYGSPSGDAPFSTSVEIAACPWKSAHRLVRVGLKGVELDEKQRPPVNLVFLIDVSGSMQSENKLPLLQRALKMLVERLGESDRVAIVVYAGNSGLALPATSCGDKSRILAALDELHAGGSTNGGEGIQLAYRVARHNLDPRGVNRVILATDGDFNVGVSSQGELIRIIEHEAASGVMLSVLGVGMGNYKDSMLEKLADKGNGNYAYIDSLAEARKVLVEQMGGTLVTIAKDVKIQVEFNPARIAAYRLIGYENRLLAAEDFNDDAKDAGEIGAGHTVTALYEVAPVGANAPARTIDPLAYRQKAQFTAAAERDEVMTLKLRFKRPQADRSELISIAVPDRNVAMEDASADFRFAAAVAEFGLILRDSAHKGDASLDHARKLAQSGVGADRGGYRSEFLQIVKLAEATKR